LRYGFAFDILRVIGKSSGWPGVSVAGGEPCEYGSPAAQRGRTARSAASAGYTGCLTISKCRRSVSSVRVRGFQLLPSLLLNCSTLLSDGFFICRAVARQMSPVFGNIPFNFEANFCRTVPPFENGPRKCPARNSFEEGLASTRNSSWGLL